VDKNRNPLLDWNMNLFISNRIQYVILTNTTSLYSMIMTGRGITSEKQFVHEALSCMHEFMIHSGNEAIYENLIEPENENILYSRIVDRRISGSMNDLIFQAKIYLDHEHTSLFEVSSLINNSPMSYLNYRSPKKEFEELCAMKDIKSIANEKNNVFYINEYSQLKTKP
jgi:hypothetical protein